MDDSLEQLVRDKIENERWTCIQLRDFLKMTYPGRRGFSLRSIQRFCQAKSIYRTSRLSSTDLDIAVSNAITNVCRRLIVLVNLQYHNITVILILQVGPTYGRKTMTGLLSSQGLRVSEVRVGRSLKRMNPRYHRARQTATARQMNPIPYHADCFGHKLHIDQNEKNGDVRSDTHLCNRWLQWENRGVYLDACEE